MCFLIGFKGDLANSFPNLMVVGIPLILCVKAAVLPSPALLFYGVKTFTVFSDAYQLLIIHRQGQPPCSRTTLGIAVNMPGTGKSGTIAAHWKSPRTRSRSHRHGCKQS
jgi:hypothetical protein